MDIKTSARPPIGRRMKPRAPPPPPAPQPAPRKIFRNVLPDGGVPGSRENTPLSTVDLRVTLPNGEQTSITEDGRKALMDVLVDLCAQYRLNPAEYTLELASAEGHSVPFKPNSVLGALDVSSAIIKERTFEAPRRPAPVPRVPEKTVRLVVNYHRGQKAVVRVSPVLSLQSLVPIICQKCDFDPARVLLLRDAVSQHELDLHKSLAELNIRELYVLDQTLAESLRSDAPSVSGAEKKGILGLLTFNRRKSKGHSAVSSSCVEVRPSTLGQSQSAMNLSRISPKQEPKKRRAPAPPPPPAQTVVESPSQTTPTAVSQTKPPSPKLETQVKKRKAPVPPPSTTPDPPVSVPIMPEVHILNAAGPFDDSMSDLSHSVEDSEAAVSMCSSSSGEDDDAKSSSLDEEETPELQLDAELVIQKAKSSNPDLNPHLALKSATKGEPEDSDLAPELKVEDTGNVRHSTMAWSQSEEKEVETVSVCSSESFVDQGYAASEGMADSPSASSEDTVSLCPDLSPSPSQPQEDSDVDEGCATWGSHHSGDAQGDGQSAKRRDSHEEADITAQIHLTLSGLDADLLKAGGHSEEPSVCMEDEIPVSVVDLDVPVTAIDDVPDDGAANGAKAGTVLSDSHDTVNSGMNLQNTNNNAQMSKTVRPGQGQEARHPSANQRTQNLPPKIKAEGPEEPKAPQRSQRPMISPVSKDAPEGNVYPPSRFPQGKITPNPMSRFGLKTFTIVPPKPVVPQTQKQAGSLRTGAIKIDEFGNMIKQREAHDPPVDVTRDTGSSFPGNAKAFWSSAEKQDPASCKAEMREEKKTREAETLKSDIPAAVKSREEKPSVQEPPKQANLASAVLKKLAVSDPAESMFFSEQRKNILMPPRRTSSQYVASAIAKYSGSTSSGSTGVQESLSPEASTGLEKRSTVPDFRPPVTAVHYNLGPRRSQSLPSQAADKQEVSKQPQIIRTSDAPKPSPVTTGKPKLSLSLSKDITATRQGPANAFRPPVSKKPELLSPVSPAAPPEPLFGPVKKFKPVVPKKVERETCLHSSLMEAIQSGEGVERLRKVSDSSRASTLKNPVNSEPESERSALLSAIRGHSNSTRLKTTRSKAAVELEQSRKVENNRVQEETLRGPRPNGGVTETASSSTPKQPTFCPPAPAFNPPPPPPPPPPAFNPPPAPSSKPAMVLAAGGNPEAAREAMMEAIRSGSGARQLRKVPVTVKTVKVNGRLGIIRATPPLSQQQ